MARFIFKLFAILAELFGLVAYENRLLAQSSAPTLQIYSTNQSVSVCWPNNAYYYMLQATPILAATNNWANVASASPLVQAYSTYYYEGPAGFPTDVNSNGISTTMMSNSGSRYFRLKQPDFLPLCSFAIFYDGLMEYSQCGAMVVNGAVHANGSIYLGTSGSVTFNAPVSCTGWIAAPLVDGITNGWNPTNSDTWNATFNGTPTVITNMFQIPTWPATNNYHAMIDPPPASENPNSFPGAVRLYNQAEMVLLVTNDISGSGNPTVQCILQISINGTLPGNDPTPSILIYTNVSPSLLKTKLPFLTLTNQFYDQREFKTNLVTQIDVGYFAYWISTNSNVQSKLPSASGIYPFILFVADQRTNSPQQMSVVRLMNGAQLPANGGFGFTMATPNPLYVWGNYNVQTAFSLPSASAGTTNTASTVPAALFADAITALSSHWTDANSYSPYQMTPAFQAVDDTINAVIVTGNMPSTDTTGTGFSGGVHNLVRLLENWTGTYLWLNTSLCRLWTSQMATNQFRNPLGFIAPPTNPYYNPPTRHYSYDQNLLNFAKIPPGMPLLFLNITNISQ